jgi:hypothetical protein
VPFVVGERKAIRVALDWTEFDPDDQTTTIALYLLTGHGRAIPLVWRTVRKNKLKAHQGQYEDEVIERVHELLDPNIRITLVADRRFGSQQRYAHLESLGWDHVIRFRENVLAPQTTSTIGGFRRTGVIVSALMVASPMDVAGNNRECNED